MTPGCSGACPTVSSGTYNNTTGVVSLTLSAANVVQAGSSFNLSGLTGTGAFASLDGLWYAAHLTTGATLVFQAPSGLGATTITGGNVNAGGASTCIAGMYIWDNQSMYVSGEEGVTIAGTRIASGGPTTFALAFQPGGPGDTNIPAGTPLSCGWGTPSSGLTGAINASTGVLTLSNLVGASTQNDYVTDANVAGDNGWASYPGVQIGTNVDSTHWNTNYATLYPSGGGIASEQMVTVR